MATTQPNRLQAGAIQPVSKPEQTSAALRPIEPNDLSEVMTFAEIAVKSSTFGLKNIEEAAFRILYGRELGLTAWASIMGVQMIQGQPSLKAATAAALIRRSGIYDFAEVESTPTACELAFFRYGRQVGSTRFTLDDAKRAGLVREGSGWAKYPGDMCFARALMRGFRRFCSDLTLGPIYSSEELADGGDVIDVQITDPQAVVEPVVETKPVKAKRVVKPVEPVNEPEETAGYAFDAEPEVETVADKVRKLDEWAERAAKRFEEKGFASFATAGAVIEEMWKEFAGMNLVPLGSKGYRAQTQAIASMDVSWAEILDNLKAFVVRLAAELESPPEENEPGSDG